MFKVRSSFTVVVFAALFFGAVSSASAADEQGRIKGLLGKAKNGVVKGLDKAGIKKGPDTTPADDVAGVSAKLTDPEATGNAQDDPKPAPTEQVFSEKTKEPIQLTVNLPLNATRAELASYFKGLNEFEGIKSDEVLGVLTVDLKEGGYRTHIRKVTIAFMKDTATSTTFKISVTDSVQYKGPNHEDPGAANFSGKLTAEHANAINARFQGKSGRVTTN